MIEHNSLNSSTNNGAGNSTSSNTASVVVAAAAERRLLARTRIDALLDQALKRQLALVVAGGGYGKTAAILDYLHRRQIRTIWLQLSEKDNIIAHFWETFSHGFSLLNPELVQKITTLELPDSADGLLYLTQMLRDELKARFSYAFVVDDLHLITAPQILGFIVRAMLVPTDNVSFIAISRQENFPDAANLLQQGTLSRIDASELAFTRGEIADYLQMQKLPVTDDRVSAIHQETEGWPFAVSLAGHFLMRDAKSDYFRVALKSNVNAMFDELFSQSSDELKRFMVRLSLINHHTPELIQSFPDGQKLMEELLRVSSLVYYDHHSCSYRIHHLMLDYVKEKQGLLTEAERLDTLRKATDWCMQNDYRIDAMLYCRELGDYDSIITTVYSYPLVIPLDVSKVLLEIMEEAPQSFYDSHPSAPIVHTRTLMTVGRTAEAMRKIREYIQCFEHRAKSVSCSRTLMGLHNMMGYAKMIDCPESGDTGFYEDFERALEYLEPDVTQTTPTSGAFQVHNVGPYAIRIGQAEPGLPERYIEALKRSTTCATLSMRGTMHGLDFLAQAELAFFRAQLADAEAHALSCVSAARNFGQYEIEGRALFILLRVYLHQGKYEQIIDALSQIEALTQHREFTNRHLLYEIASSWFYMTIGEAERVESWLKNDLWSVGSNRIFEGLEDIIKVKYFIAQKKYQAMQAFVESRLRLPYGVSRLLFGKIGLGVARAVASAQLHDMPEALKLLSKSYSLAEPNGLDMPFIEMGNNMRSLATAALKASSRADGGGTPGRGGGAGSSGAGADGGGLASPPKEWLESIRSRSSTFAKRVAHIRSCYLDSHSRKVNVQLTSREIDILMDLSHGLSRTEISLGRSISLNTVKTMLQLIYDKLGATNALDAVRIATTRGLI